MLIERGSASQNPRVAVAAFYSPRAFVSTIDALVELGVGALDMMIVAGSPIETSLAALQSDGRRAYRGIAVRPSASIASPSRGAAQSALSGPGLLDTPFETWGTAATAEGVRRHLGDGACALIVLVETIDLEQRVLKVLLANSVGPVQQHDVGARSQILAP
jgi:hypothetical protein